VVTVVIIRSSDAIASSNNTSVVVAVVVNVDEDDDEIPLITVIKRSDTAATRPSTNLERFIVTVSCSRSDIFIGGVWDSGGCCRVTNDRIVGFGS